MGKRNKNKVYSPEFLRILVCGSRNWDNKEVIRRELEKRFDYDNTLVTVIHGCARGADTYAGKVAKEHDIEVKEYPADWQGDGLAAGYRRNQRMLDEGRPTLVLAFTRNMAQSKGTKDMVERAQAAGIPVKIFDE